MIISSRPSFDTSAIGPGPYLLALNLDQLELVAALISLVRLGQGHKYREAAYELSTMLDEVAGDLDFTFAAFNKVDPHVTIDTLTGEETYPASDATIEV